MERKKLREASQGLNAKHVQVGDFERLRTWQELDRNRMRLSEQRVGARLDLVQPIRAPTLANPRQARMTLQLFLNTITNEPVNSDVDVSLAHQLAVMHDTAKQACEERLQRFNIHRQLRCGVPHAPN